ncbi:MAG: hypothetical protein STSR0004_16250 [Peptococcaceae bacterium]
MKTKVVFQKVILVLVIILIALLGFWFGTGYSEQKIKLMVYTGDYDSLWKETTCDPPLIMQNGRVFVPLRAVAEILKAEIKWNDAEKAVYLKSESFVIRDAQQEAAAKQKEEMEKLVRTGKIVSVSPEEIKLKVEKGGGDIGKTVTLKTTEYSNIQIDMTFVSSPGKKINLKDWFKNGDNVNALVKDERILALHRELRPGEKEPNIS